MTDATSAPAAAAPGPVAGLGILAIVVVLVFAWAIIGTMLLRIGFSNAPFSPRRHPERGRTGAERSARSA